ncbi:hypothetical protein GCM10022232_75950 [Streptomyces plumbiresistens]|uniref:Uncharacterized protein n=1 Tax=Streptomyces plumbiresistens TaxID=511811 RepID=A0ABP7T2M8_9ACTN
MTHSASLADTSDLPGLELDALSRWFGWTFQSHVSRHRRNFAVGRASATVGDARIVVLDHFQCRSNGGSPLGGRILWSLDSSAGVKPMTESDIRGGLPGVQRSLQAIDFRL